MTPRRTAFPEEGLSDKVSENYQNVDKLADIVIYLKKHPKSPSRSIATLIGLGETSPKNYLRRLISLGLVKAEGANKNRTYSVCVEISLT